MLIFNVINDIHLDLIIIIIDMRTKLKLFSNVYFIHLMCYYNLCRNFNNIYIYFFFYTKNRINKKKKIRVYILTNIYVIKTKYLFIVVFVFQIKCKKKEKT